MRCSDEVGACPRSPRTWQAVRTSYTPNHTSERAKKSTKLVSLACLGTGLSSALWSDPVPVINRFADPLHKILIGLLCLSFFCHSKEVDSVFQPERKLFPTQSETAFTANRSSEECKRVAEEVWGGGLEQWQWITSEISVIIYISIIIYYITFILIKKQLNFRGRLAGVEKDLCEALPQFRRVYATTSFSLVITTARKKL